MGRPFLLMGLTLSCVFYWTLTPCSRAGFLLPAANRPNYLVLPLLRSGLHPHFLALAVTFFSSASFYHSLIRPRTSLQLSFLNRGIGLILNDSHGRRGASAATAAASAFSASAPAAGIKVMGAAAVLSPTCPVSFGWRRS